MELSIIVSAYNEFNNVSIVYENLRKACENILYEIIFVNDGSIDKTKEELINLYNKDKKHVRVINFSRNFGKDAAIYAGIEHACGKYVCLIDADMEHNPKYVKTMYEFLVNNQEYDQVAMIMNKRESGSFLKKVGSKLFYKIMNAMSDVPFKQDAGDFRMFNKKVADANLKLLERNRFSKGIFNWLGFNTYYMKYDVGKRVNGKTKFNIKKSFNYAINGIISHSVKPLKLITFVGVSLFIIGLFLLIYGLVKNVNLTTIIGLITLLFGIQMISLGIISEYISKIFIEVKGRPAYIIESKLGISD